jgi:hypothetical protein
MFFVLCSADPFGRSGREGVGDGVNDGEGFGVGDGAGVKSAPVITSIASVDETPCVLIEALLGRMVIRADAIDTAAAMAATHRALSDMPGVESVFSLKPHLKQYAASSGASVPHFWQYTAMPF